MIESTLTGNFGVAVEDGKGMILNMQLGQDQIVHIPFVGEALFIMLKEAVKGLDEEQKRRLIPMLTSGIVVPGPGGFQNGPQG